MTAVVTFYRFVRLEDPPAVRDTLESHARQRGLKGTILLAGEGINGTLTGALEALESFIDELAEIPQFAQLSCRYSSAERSNPVFHRLKVRVREEIVHLGQSGVDPARRTGVHVDAQRWNELLDDPAVVVVDTRNAYEIAIGTFPGAQDPGTRTFRQFPDYVRDQLEAPAGQSRPPVAMFCTGGIRCEKASAYLLEQGFAEVYQLQGGILGYLDTVAPQENRWQGECFVFDQRVSVDDTLRQGSFKQCFACRRPLDAADLQAPEYLEGVSCGYCIGERDERQRAGFRERARQVELAAERGVTHIGASYFAGAGQAEPAD